MIVRRASSGLLHRMYRLVYLVGHPAPLPGARELGAVLACGDRTFISHRSAAELWGLVPAQGAPVEVTVVGRSCRSREDIRVHWTDALDAIDRGAVGGIPATSPVRAVIDFAADAEADELEVALSEARALRLIKDGELEAALDRAGNRAGVARMRRLLRSEGDHGYTRSKAERLMREAGLSQPLCNRRLHGYRVDFLWPEQRLVVEVDGYQFHGHRSAFEHEPIRVGAVIAAALAPSRLLA
jgi:hypothetical protein